ncbi:MAG: NYN domain-containing protein [Candidatus Aminicenantaceae bacterium]
MVKKSSSNIFKEQRVGVFVDVQNMYYSAKYIYKKKVNFSSILNEAVRGRRLIRAIAYVIRADVKDESNFFDALKNIGYQVKSKDLQVFFGGAKKGDWDVGISVDMIELAPKLDTMVLVSGDGDFVPLVEHLKHALGCYLEVMAFGKSSSQKLIEETDCFIDLDPMSQKFLICK